MAENIKFDVEVATGRSQSNINDVTAKIDELKSSIADLKKNKQSTIEINGDVKSIQELQRELSKLQAVYTSWIQQATKIDTIPIGNVKKQLDELKRVFTEWNGQVASFGKDFMGKFMLPNSMADQARAYKEILSQLQGSVTFKGQEVDAKKLDSAIVQLTERYKQAAIAAKDLDNSLKVKSTRQQQLEQEQIAQKAAAEVAKQAAQAKAQAAKLAADAVKQAAQKEAQAVKDAAKAEADAQRQAAEEAKKNDPVNRYIEQRERLEELRAKLRMNYLDNHDSNPDLYDKNFSAINTQYQTLSENMRKAEKDIRKTVTASSTLDATWERLGKRAQWVWANFGVNLLYQGVSYFLDNVKNVESQMAQFSQVMSTNSHAVNSFDKSLHDLTFEDVIKGVDTTTQQSLQFRHDLEYMKNSLVDFAVKYGESSKDVMESATLWGRKYKDNATILTMTDAAMKLAVADSFSVAEANKNLESSIVQWGFQINNNNDAMIVSNKIIDSWTALAHKMAVSAQDLSAANQRCAQSMNAMGLSFDEGQAIIASTLANTQQKGGEIGNALKSIMGSIHTDKAIKEIESLGIAVTQTGENGKKEFRDVGTVLMELMLKTQDTHRNLEALLKDISGGKWQWNKAGALMNFQTYIQALKLSTSSYGFTAEQVGMQMDTLARRVEGLKQAFINLTTSSQGGAFSDIMKDIIGLATKLLTTLNGFSSSQLGLIIVMNLVAFKGRAFVNVMKSMASSVNIFSKSLSKVDKANAVLRIISVVADLVAMSGGLNSKLTDQQSQFGKLNQQLEVTSELYSRQQEALPLVDKMCEAYQTLTDQMTQYNEDSDEYQNRLKERNDVEATLVNIIGDQQEATLKEKGFSEEAIADVKKAEKDQANQRIADIKTIRGEIANLAEKMRTTAKEECDELDDQKHSWLEVMGAIWKFGSAFDMIAYGFRKIMAVIYDAQAAFSKLMLSMDEGMQNSWIGQKLHIDRGYYIDLDKNNIEWSENAADYQRSIAENILGNIQDKITMQADENTASALKSSTDGFHNPLDQDHLGGSENDEPEKTSKGKHPKVRDMDGNPLSIPSDRNYATAEGVNDTVTWDLEQKIRVLAAAYTRKTGDKLLVTSMFRPGDPKNHGKQIAFDVAGGQLDSNQALRRWLEQYATWIGLRPWDEYDDHPEDARGGANIHFDTMDQPAISDIISGSSNVPTKKDNSVQYQLYKLFHNDEAFNMSDKAAWAAMARIGYESNGFDPAAEQDPDDPNSGIGLMQWSNDANGNGRRKDYLNFVAMRAAKGGSSDWRDIRNQIAFIKQERLGSEFDSWNNYINSVTDDTSAIDDVTSFTHKVERAGVDNIDQNMGYYNDVSSYYANGISLKDSSKNQEKQLTPEERAKKQAETLKKQYDSLAKSLESLAKIYNGQYTAAIENVSHEEAMSYQNAKTMQERIDATTKKITGLTDAYKKYGDAVKAVAKNLDDKTLGLLSNGLTVAKFMGMSADEQEKIIVDHQNASDLFKPLLTTMQAIVDLEDKRLSIEKEINKTLEEEIKDQRNLIQNIRDSEDKRADNSMKEWELSNSSRTYDDSYKNEHELEFLKMKAQAAKDYYERIKLIEGAKKNGGDPEKIETAKIAWLEANDAANKYANTLKNTVRSQFTEMADSIFIEGNSIRNFLKNLWKDLAKDALTLLLSGGRQGTNSLGGNVLRLLFGDKKNSTSNANTANGWMSSGSSIRNDKSSFDTATWNHNRGSGKSNEYAQFLSMIGTVDSKGKTHLPSVSSSNWLESFIPIASTLGTKGGNKLQAGNDLNRTDWLQMLLGLFGSVKGHADGGEINKEEIATLGEGNKREYVIPTTGNSARNKALLYRAAKDLGVASDSTHVVPAFKNQELAKNGLPSTELKQSAIYMSEMKKQTATMVSLLNVIANGQANGGSPTVAQPVVVQQNMSMDEFTKMMQRAKAYNYISQ